MVKRVRKSATYGGTNVFADIGLDQPQEALAKAQIVEAIAELIERQKTSQQAAAKLVRLTQPQISRLLRGDARQFSYERLMRVLTALGQDVDITIRPTRDRKKRGRVLLTSENGSSKPRKPSKPKPKRTTRSKSSRPGKQTPANRPDSEIDFSDAPEIKDFRGAVRGRFYRPKRAK